MLARFIIRIDCGKLKRVNYGKIAVSRIIRARVRRVRFGLSL